MPRRSPALVQKQELFFVNFDKPVPQSSLHQAIYKARSDVRAVFHFHSPAVVLLSVVGQTIRPMHNYRAIFYQGVPLYTGTGQVESPSRAGEMAKLLGDVDADRFDGQLRSLAISTGTQRSETGEWRRV
jgi:ribulose-5-phosphate 4-epimerase/fuculose-1-phosphate aldolase